MKEGSEELYICGHWAKCRARIRVLHGTKGEANRYHIPFVLVSVFFARKMLLLIVLFVPWVFESTEPSQLWLPWWQCLDFQTHPVSLPWRRNLSVCERGQVMHTPTWWDWSDVLLFDDLGRKCENWMRGLGLTCQIHSSLAPRMGFGTHFTRVLKNEISHIASRIWIFCENWRIASRSNALQRYCLSMMFSSSYHSHKDHSYKDDKYLKFIWTKITLKHLKTVYQGPSHCRRLPPTYCYRRPNLPFSLER